MKARPLAAVVVALVPAIASAQPTSAPVQVTVAGAVQLTRAGTTDFGPIPNQAQTKTINPAAPTGAQQTAMFTASGAAGATIVVTWAPTIDLCLEGSSCTTTSPFTPNLSRGDCFFCQGSSVPIASGETAVLNGGGEHYFWLGGTIVVPANPAAGLYRADFVLSAAYQ